MSPPQPPPTSAEPRGLGCALSLAFVFALVAIGSALFRFGALQGGAARTLDGYSPLWVRGLFAISGLGLAAALIGGVGILLALYGALARPEPYVMIATVGSWLTVVAGSIAVGLAAATTPGGFARADRVVLGPLLGLAEPIAIALLGTAAWQRLRRARVEDPDGAAESGAE